MARLVAPAETVFAVENTYRNNCLAPATGLLSYYLSDWDALCGAGGLSNSDNHAAPLGLHNDWTNVGFMEGHAKTMNWKELTCVNYASSNNPQPTDPGFLQQCALSSLAKDYWSLTKIPTNTPAYNTAANLGGCPGP